MQEQLARLLGDGRVLKSSARRDGESVFACDDAHMEPVTGFRSTGGFDWCARCLAWTKPAGKAEARTGRH